ncbi:hypothetical protein LCGC14_2619980, partial [marine sediment metagenome]
LEFSDIKTRVKDYANITNITGADTKAGRAVNDSLRKLAGERRWIGLRRQGTITPVASQQSYSLTSLTGFNYPLRVFYLINGVQQPITILSEEEWANKNDNDSVGDPDICAFLEISGEQKLYVSPLPSASFVALYNTITIDFDKKPTELSGDSDVPEIPPTNCQMALIYYAVAELLAKQGDLKGLAVWEAKADKELSKYFTSDIHFKGVKRQSGKPSMGILHGTTLVRPQRDYRDR